MEKDFIGYDDESLSTMRSNTYVTYLYDLLLEGTCK